MLTRFEKKVAGFIKANGLLGPAERVLLAVSGGIDSTALLYVMCALKAEGVLSTDFACAHINHQLRGAEADKDEDFVIAEAAKLKLAVITKRVDARGFARRNKLSVETAARKLRIESLLDIAKANNCNRITTGHQKNDNAETILQRLARGTGFRGLAGIWPERTFASGIGFVRPLLCVRRDEIIEYLRKRNLKWRDDHTNVDCTYRRNYIRHRLLPRLQQDCDDSIVEQISALAQSARKFYSLVCSSAEQVWPRLADCTGDKAVLDLQMFSTQPQPVKVELVRRSLAAIGCGERNLIQRHYERILQLAQQNVSGKKIELPDGFVIWHEYGKLIFARLQKTEYRIQDTEDRNLPPVVLEVPGKTKFGNYLIEATVLDAPFTSYHLPITSYQLTERFDSDKVKLPLVVRSRQEGDKFVPLGLAGEKKVGKFLTAAKVPQELRQKLLIIADSEKIIWLVPIRMSEQAKVTGETRKILQLQITDAELPYI